MKDLYKQNPLKNSKFTLFIWGKLLSLSFLLGTSLLMYATFIIAYINPNKKVIVDINSVGEANFELIFLSILLIISLITLYNLIKEEARNAAQKI